MNPEIERVFLAVVELDAGARAAYYEANHIPEEIRGEVDSLLAFDRGATQFIAKGLLSSLHRKMHEEDMAAHYGPYRIVKPIGAGGMGTVYLAERVDGEVVQRVAIKLLRDGGRGEERVERFLRERQILATLQHPNISRLIDAGHREDGQPYLVMDYVDGKPVDEYGAGLGLRAKIELMLEICGAVSYAHRNLVVHRDLKPSNILVDSAGRPHLLDFGIAKILDETADSAVTGQRMLTPDYSSPEQICERPVTTATDVYSLGGVLYKLVTGTGPHHFQGSTPEGVLVAIQTREPVRPSQLAPELRGDLDLILIKALRKDPEERYHTVDEFAADLRAYLDSRPISARKGELVYRCRKFLRRYWIPTVAAAVAMAAMMTGFAIANRQRLIAQRRFDEVRQLSNKLFDIEVEVRTLPGSTKARQLIIETSLGYLSRLANEVQDDPKLALDLGFAYLQVARIQGGVTSRNLGQTDLAEENFRRAEQLSEQVTRAQPANREAMRLAALVAHDRMVLVAQKGGRRDGARRAEALALARKAAEWTDKFRANATVDESTEALTLYRNIADQYLQGHQLDDALQICARGSELARSLDRRNELGMFFWVTALVHQQRGDLDEARKGITESVDLLEKYSDKNKAGHTVSLAHVLIWQGRILGADGGISQGRRDEAVQVLDRAFRIVDEMVHADANDQSNRVRLGTAGTQMAAILRHSDAKRALQVYEHTLQHLNEMPNSAAIQRLQVETLAGLAGPLQRLGRKAEARQRLDAAFEALAKLKLYPAEQVIPGSVTFKAIRSLADFEGATGNPIGAVETYEKLVIRMRAANLDAENLLEDAVDLSNVYRALADLHRRNHQLELAAAVEAKRTALWKGWAPKIRNRAFVQRQLSGGAD